MFFLTHGTVFGLRDDDGRLVATAALLPYPPVAWISMVLVTASRRRRGLASRLMQACIAAARHAGVTPWLDATPAGATVYGPMGFHPLCRSSGSAGAVTSRLRRNRPSARRGQRRWPIWFIATARAWDLDRSALLTACSMRDTSRIHAHNSAVAPVREGRKARQIGPLFTDRAADAIALIDGIVANEDGPHIIDVVDSNHDVTRHLIQSGWINGKTVPAHAIWRTTARETRGRRHCRSGIRIKELPLHHTAIHSDIRRLIGDGTVILAHPLALDANRKLDPRRQRALTWHHLDAGVGGLAAGVHTTQFAIRDVGLYRPVLELAAETAAAWAKRPLALVAGLRGSTSQAVSEARTALGIGYHAGLLSLAAMKGASEDEIITHWETVAREIPTGRRDTGEPLADEPLRIVDAQVDRLERDIDRVNAGLKPLRRFVLPAGMPAAAHLHVARIVRAAPSGSRWSCRSRNARAWAHPPSAISTGCPTCSSS